jgi:hypothetical protein
VIPQYNPNIGPQILENSKGLFLTTKEQIVLRQENKAKLKAIEKTNAVRLDVNKIDTAKVNVPVKQKENNDESHDEQDTFEGKNKLWNQESQKPKTVLSFVSFYCCFFSS